MVQATDLAGNTASVTRSFTIDLTAPTITINGVSNGLYYNVDKTITFSQTDAHPGTTTATLNGSAFASNTLVSVEGTYSLVVTATDAAGNSAQQTVVFTIDKTAPAVTITGVTAGAYYKQAVTITFSQSDANAGPLTATVDGVAFLSNQTVSVEGQHTLVVTATDLAGNTTSITRVFTIDTTPPVITINGVSNGVYYNVNKTITFSQTDTNPGTTTATLDGVAFTSNTTVSSEATHTLVVTATDAAGNITQQTVVFTIDKTAPVVTVSGVASGAYYNHTVTITFSQTDANPGPLTATVDNAAFLSNQTVSAEGQHTLVVTATDLAGNTTSITRVFTIDTTAPTITINGVSNGVYYNVNKTITFSQTDTNPGTTTATLDGVAFTTNSTVSSEATHTLVVTATDAASNTTQQTVVFTIDKTAPVISVSGISSGAFYNHSVTITLSQTEANPGPISATVDGLAFLSGQSVSAEGVHTLRVNTTDLAGNAATQVSVTFTVDYTPPSITFQSPTGPYVKGTITIQATASDGLDPSPTITLTAPSNTTNTSGNSSTWTTTYATGNGTLTMTATAMDAAGNISAPVSRTVTMDNTAPTLNWASTGAYEDINTTPHTWWTNTATPTLTGTASDTNGAQVHVYVAGTEAAGSPITPNADTTWSFTLPAGTPLITSGTKDIQVTATDPVGNIADGGHRAMEADTAGPGVGANATTVDDETKDTLSWGTNSVPSHTHTSTNATTNLGSSTGCTLATAPVVSKHTYLLATSHTPVIGEMGGPATDGSNPLHWSFNITDINSGIDVTQATYSVNDGAQTWGPFAIDSSTAIAAGYTVQFDLHRDGAKAVPTLGVFGQVKSGLFQVTVTAKDHVGNVNTITRCWVHHPLAPELHIIYNGVNSGAKTAAASNLDALGSYALGAAGTVSTLVNGGTRGASLVEVDVQNGTGEPEYVQLSGVAPAGTTTYEKRWTLGYVKSSISTSGTWLCNADPAPNNCSYPPVPSSAGLQTGSVTNLNFGARAFNIDNATSPIELDTGGGPGCPECAANQFRLDATSTTFPKYALLSTTIQPLNGTTPVFAAPVAGSSSEYTRSAYNTSDGTVTLVWSGHAGGNLDTWCQSLGGAGPYCYSRASYSPIEGLGHIVLSIPVNAGLANLASAGPTTTQVAPISWGAAQLDTSAIVWSPPDAAKWPQPSPYNGACYDPGSSLPCL